MMNRRTMLKGGLVLAATAHSAAVAPIIADPLLSVSNAYKSGLAAFNAIPDDILTRENEEQFVADTYADAHDQIAAWDQPAMTRDGAIEALRFMKEQDVFSDAFGEPLRRAVLGYLESLPV